MNEAILLKRSAKKEQARFTRIRKLAEIMSSLLAERADPIYNIFSYDDDYDGTDQNPQKVSLIENIKEILREDGIDENLLRKFDKLNTIGELESWIDECLDKDHLK